MSEVSYYLEKYNGMTKEQLIAELITVNNVTLTNLERANHKVKKLLKQTIKENVGGSDELNTIIGGVDSSVLVNAGNANDLLSDSSGNITSKINSIKTDVGGSSTLESNVASIKSSIGGSGNMTVNVDSIKTSVGGSSTLLANINTIKTDVGGSSSLSTNINTVKSSIGGSGTMAENVDSIKAAVGGNSTLLADITSIKTDVGGSSTLLENVYSISSKIYSGSDSTLTKLNSVIDDVDMFDDLLILPGDMVNANISNFGINGSILSFDINGNTYNYEYSSNVYDGNYIDFSYNGGSLILSLKNTGSNLNNINAVRDYTNAYFSRYNFIVTKELKTKISNVLSMLVETPSDLLQDVTNIVNKVKPNVTLDSSLNTIKNKLGYSNDTLDNNVNDLFSYVSPVQNDFIDSNLSISSITKFDQNIDIVLNGSETYSYTYSNIIASDSNIIFSKFGSQLIIKNKSGSALDYEDLYRYLLYLYPQNTKITWDIYPSLTNLNTLIAGKGNLIKSVYSLRSSITSNPSNSISTDISSIRDKIVLSGSINLESDIDSFITNRFGSSNSSTGFNDATSIEAKIEAFIDFLDNNKNSSNIVTLDFTNGITTLGDIIDSVVIIT